MADLRAGLVHKGFREVESYPHQGKRRSTSDLRSVPKVEFAFETAPERLLGSQSAPLFEHLSDSGELPSDRVSCRPTDRASLPALLEAQGRRYVTFLKEDPDDKITAIMNGWDVAGQRAHIHTREVCRWSTHPLPQARPSNARIGRGAVVATTKDGKAESALGEMWGQDAH